MSALPAGLPASVLEAIGDASVVSITQIGRGQTSYLLHSKVGWPFRLLKTADQVDQFIVVGEIDRLDWLDRRLPVPKVMASEPTADGGHAALFALPAGFVATDPENPHDQKASVELFAKALRFVHEVPVDKCPFSNKLELRLRSIRRRLKAGRYDSLEFSEAYRRYPVTRLYEMLVETQPSEDDVVFSHGAFDLGIVHLDDNGVSGIAEWSRAGVADRYVDLALAARSIAARATPELIPRFFECYGIPNPDPLRLDYYQLLAEFT